MLPFKQLAKITASKLSTITAMSSIIPLSSQRRGEAGGQGKKKIGTRVVMLNVGSEWH